jgi:predicted transport protein
VSDLKLFRLSPDGAVELRGSASPLEKPLQALIERNMETLFGVRLVASEYSTGKKHGGRIDSLGLDENGSPVIFEYKRAQNENVINQGLFYLDWMLDHRAEFEKLVQQRLGDDAANSIEWSGPRLMCVAGDFNRYDEHAISQIDRSIELVRYRLYDDDFLTFELLASTSASATSAGEALTPKSKSAGAPEKTAEQYYNQAPSELRGLYDSLEANLLRLGDDVTKTVRKNYFAFRRIRNFACVEVHPQSQKLLVYLKVDLEGLMIEKGFTRDVSKIGHFGTGNLEVTIRDLRDLDRARELIALSYGGS